MLSLQGNSNARASPKAQTSVPSLLAVVYHYSLYLPVMQPYLRVKQAPHTLQNLPSQLAAFLKLRRVAKAHSAPDLWSSSSSPSVSTSFKSNTLRKRRTSPTCWRLNANPAFELYFRTRFNSQSSTSTGKSTNMYLSTSSGGSTTAVSHRLSY